MREDPERRVPPALSKGELSPKEVLYLKAKRLRRKMRRTLLRSRQMIEEGTRLSELDK